MAYSTAPYRLKKICIILSALAIFFRYLSYRMNLKCKNLQPNLSDGWPENRGDSGGPKNLIMSCSKNGPIMIKFTKTINFLKNAETIMEKSNLSSEYICSTKFIEICYKEPCEKMDLRIFIYEYFVEVIKNPIFMQKNHKEEEEPYYFLIRDSEWSQETENEVQKYQNQFKVLGFMLGLAIVTDTYIDVKFAPFFHCDSESVKNFGEYIDLVDKDQYNIWRKIEQENGLKLFKFTPNSLKPFGLVKKKNSQEFYANQFPFDKALSELLFKPYATSKKFVNQGLELILGKEFHNSMPDINWTFYNRSLEGFKYNDNKVDMKKIFWTRSAGDANQHMNVWKDFSDFDWDTRIFWKAFLKFKGNDKLKIYHLITGFKTIPLGGLKRLPRTKILIGDNGIFSKKFEVQIKKFSTVSSIVEEIKNLLKIKV